MTAFKALEDWEKITTPVKLKEVILQTAKILAEQGNKALSERFTENAKRVPVNMEKESINYVLFAMCVEVGTI